LGRNAAGQAEQQQEGDKNSSVHRRGSFEVGRGTGRGTPTMLAAKPVKGV
jgi:hypothetical protein